MIDAKYLDALEACNRCRCGCCKDGCPVYNTMLEEQVSARGRNLIIRAYLSGLIEPSPRLARAVYSCLLCRLDEENCNARIPNAEIYEKIREDLVLKGYGPLPEHEPLLASLKNYGNPWMQPSLAREKWIKKADVDTKKKTDKKESLLYFAGCTFALDPAIQSVPVSTAKLLQKAGVEFAVLGKDEFCCGSTALRIGNKKLFIDLQNKNRSSLSGYKTVVTSCSGCFKTMSQDYAKNDGDPQTIHSVQLLEELIKSGKLKPKKLEAKVTYHDPCHLGRHSGLYDAPRNILKSIPGIQLIEMRNNREKARCCGAGAGLKTASPITSLDIAKRRIDEACQTGAEILVSACPFCEQNLSEAANALGKKIKVMDISELLLQACS